MSIRLFSASISGIEAKLIDVEVDSTNGLHSFNIVGLPDKAIQESKDRIAAAIRNNKLIPPSAKHKKIIINLAPADLKKEGPAYDLPIAIGYLLETNQIKFNTEDKLFAGELSLDGSLKAINGVLSMTILAKNLGFKELIVPFFNIKEASSIDDISLIGVKNLKEVIGHLNGLRPLKPYPKHQIKDYKQVDSSSWDAIKGHYLAKKALVIAAAGGHNILMSGPPGSGKTLLAKLLNDLMPALTFNEAVEVARIYSSVGLLKDKTISYQRPFRNPHHSTSTPAIIGGGNIPKPGEISLAHRGVLFLDELPEFPRNVLESLRQPLEEGVVTVSRVSGSVTLPAKFMLVAAMNPCPCGNYGDERAQCVCNPIQVIKYRKKISGPLLDRIDIQINVPRETIKAKGTVEVGESFNKVKENIAKAKEVQLKRFKNLGIYSNSEINHKNVDSLCVLEDEAQDYLERAANTKNLSLRSFHKIKKIARTIADLGGHNLVNKEHVAEAIRLKINDKLTDILA